MDRGRDFLCELECSLVATFLVSVPAAFDELVASGIIIAANVATSKLSRFLIKLPHILWLRFSSLAFTFSSITCFHGNLFLNLTMLLVILTEVKMNKARLV